VAGGEVVEEAVAGSGGDGIDAALAMVVEGSAAGGSGAVNGQQPPPFFIDRSSGESCGG